MHYRINAKPVVTVERINLKAKTFFDQLSIELGAIKWFFINWYRNKQMPKYRIIKTLYAVNRLEKNATLD